MADPNAATLPDLPHPSTEDDHIFYNVLPPERANGPLTNTGADAASAPAQTLAPRVSNASASAGAPAQAARLRGLNPRVLLIVGVAIVILAVGGFFAYRLLSNTTEPEPLPIVNQPEPIDESPPQQEGVTTQPEWQQQYFGAEVCQNLNVCGDDSDPDRDGLTNLEESRAETDPNNSDSDGDGLSDGDELHIFATDALKSKTRDSQYTDADYAKYGYDVATDRQFSPDQLAGIIAKIKEKGLHQPTITTLGEESLKYYDFTSTSQPTPDPLQGVDTSAAAQLERDIQRQDTVKKIGAALLKYQTDNKTFPTTTEFEDMVTAIKPYVSVATNFSDPINKDRYIYGYIAGNNGTDFTLTYFSETQKLLIKYTAQQAQADAAKASASELDDLRARDLETLQTALLLYSSHNIDAHSTQQYVFPPVDRYKAELVNGRYISQIPVDPKTGQDYPYTVSDKFDTFTVKALLDAPPAGMTGYVCDQDQCKTF